MPFKSKAQQRFMFAQHPRIAKRWAREMKGSHKSIKSLPKKLHPQKNPQREKLAYERSPAGYWYGRSAVRRLEGASPSGTGQKDVPLNPRGFGTMYGTGKPKKGATKTAFEIAFSDEICKIAAGPSRTTAVRLARRAAPIVAKRIRGVRRRYRTLRKKVKGARS